MASEEHKKLAEYIKNVHQSLRINARNVGADQAWRDHCEQRETLKLYADAMHQLATEHWESNPEKLANSRIQWIVEHSLKYFMKGGIENERRKELKSAQYSNVSCAGVDFGISSATKLILLDVGSCYNPFKKYSFLSVLPIDLNPACSDVFEADFLNLSVSSDTIATDDITKQLPIQYIPKDHFDIVVFSLLLEYLPSCHQRYICCKKAYTVLKPEGLLFIISPDSKHSSANSSLMRKWRICLAHLGFTRIVYEKLPHIHCMAFRKNQYICVSQRWAQRAMAQDNMLFDLEDDSIHLGELMKIPQDDTDYVTSVVVNSPIRTTEDDKFVVDMFQELPLYES